MTIERIVLIYYSEERPRLGVPHYGELYDTLHETNKRINFVDIKQYILN